MGQDSPSVCRVAEHLWRRLTTIGVPTQIAAQRVPVGCVEFTRRRSGWLQRAQYKRHTACPRSRCARRWMHSWTTGRACAFRLACTGLRACALCSVRTSGDKQCVRRSCESARRPREGHQGNLPARFVHDPWRGQRAEDRSEGERYYSERAYGSFTRTINVPSPVKPDNIRARLRGRPDVAPSPEGPEDHYARNSDRARAIARASDQEEDDERWRVDDEARAFVQAE